jgi:peptide/nickel transport system permease protein
MALDPQPSAARAREKQGPWALALRRFLRNRVAVAALGVFVLIVLFVLAAPLWAEHVAETGPNQNHTLDTIEVDGEQLDVVNVEGQPLGAQWFAADGKFFLGADGRLGRDEMVRLMYGGRVSLAIGIGTALFTTAFAVLLGLLAGYYRGWVDTLISRTVDVLLAIPYLLLATGLAAACTLGQTSGGGSGCLGGLIKPGLGVVIFVIAFTSWTYMARIVRGQVLSLREKEFVEASRSMGASDMRIVFRELLPNLTAPIIVYASILIPQVILYEAALSFLGVGVTNQPSWGQMISDATPVFSDAWWYMLFPGLALVFTVLAFNFVGDAMQDALNPRKRRS